MYMTHQEPKYVLSNSTPIPIDRKQARLYIYIDPPAHAHAYTSTNMLCKEGLCTYEVPIGIYVCERVCPWARTCCTRTRTLAHMRAHTRTHARSQTLRVHAVPRRLRVSARARVRVSACQRAQMRECGLFQGVDTIHSV
jgi:hypothetical protein